MRFVPKNKKKIIILALVIVLVVVGGAFALYKKTDDPKPQNAYPDSVGQKYEGPTKEEKERANQHKDEVVKRMEAKKQAENNGNSAEKQVTPVITNVSQDGQQVTVNSYISGIFEDGGTCTIIAQQGGSKVTKKTEAFANATTTDCAPAFINISEFPSKGTWSFTVQYSSGSAQGTSEARTLTL